MNSFVSAWWTELGPFLALPLREAVLTAVTAPFCSDSVLTLLCIYDSSGVRRLPVCLVPFQPLHTYDLW